MKTKEEIEAEIEEIYLNVGIPDGIDIGWIDALNWVLDNE